MMVAVPALWKWAICVSVVVVVAGLVPREAFKRLAISFGRKLRMLVIVGEKAIQPFPIDQNAADEIISTAPPMLA